jgi:hypothetical protein
MAAGIEPINIDVCQLLQIAVTVINDQCSIRVFVIFSADCMPFSASPRTLPRSDGVIRAPARLRETSPVASA